MRKPQVKFPGENFQEKAPRKRRGVCAAARSTRQRSKAEARAAALAAPDERPLVEYRPGEDGGPCNTLC